jgi:hypothetical protein
MSSLCDDDGKFNTYCKLVDKDFASFDETFKALEIVRRF